MQNQFRDIAQSLSDISRSFKAFETQRRLEQQTLKRSLESFDLNQKFNQRLLPKIAESPRLDMQKIQKPLNIVEKSILDRQGVLRASEERRQLLHSQDLLPSKPKFKPFLEKSILDRQGVLRGSEERRQLLHSQDLLPSRLNLKTVLEQSILDTQRSFKAFEQQIQLNVQRPFKMVDQSILDTQRSFKALEQQIQLNVQRPFKMVDQSILEQQRILQNFQQSLQLNRQKSLNIFEKPSSQKIKKYIEKYIKNKQYIDKELSFLFKNSEDKDSPELEKNSLISKINYYLKYYNVNDVEPLEIIAIAYETAIKTILKRPIYKPYEWIKKAVVWIIKDIGRKSWGQEPIEYNDELGETLLHSTATDTYTLMQIEELEKLIDLIFEPRTDLDAEILFLKYVEDQKWQKIHNYLVENHDYLFTCDALRKRYSRMIEDIKQNDDFQSIYQSLF